MSTAAFSSTNRSLTRVRAVVHRHGKDPIELHGSGTRGPGLGSKVDIVSVDESAQLGMEPGRFTIGIKEGKFNIEREIEAGDWVVFHWIRNGKMIFGQLGQIVVVTRSRRTEPATGAIDEDWVLICESFGRVFARTQIWFDDYTNYRNNAGGQILGQRMGWVPGGSPDGVVARLVGAWLSGTAVDKALIGTSWAWPESLRHLGSYFLDGLLLRVGQDTPIPITDYQLRSEQAPRAGTRLRGESFDEAQLFAPNPGTMLSDLMLEWSNDLLNELFFDVEVNDPFGSDDPSRPVPMLWIRERPFVVAPGVALGVDGAIVEEGGLKSPWFKLPTTRLTRADITNDEVSFNDAERFNLFLLYASGTGLTNFDQYLAYPPSYDEASLARHGIRKFERTTRFSAVANGNADWILEIGVWHRLLVSWYALNHRWLSGSKTIPTLLPTRIGERLIVGEDGDPKREQFYVEGVSKRWRYPGNASTTLQLTRGYVGSDEDLVKEVEEAVGQFKRRSIIREGNDGIITTGNLA